MTTQVIEPSGHNSFYVIKLPSQQMIGECSYAVVNGSFVVTGMWCESGHTTYLLLFRALRRKARELGFTKVRATLDAKSDPRMVKLVKSGRWKILATLIETDAIMPP